MTVRTQLSFKEYLNLMYVLTYRKALVIFITLGAFLNILIITLHKWGIMMNRGSVYDSNQLFIGFIILVGIPVAIYFSTKRNYDSNKRIREWISYDFSGHEVMMTGESFTSTLDLNTSYKILELNKWFLIYSSNRVANIISKNNLSDAEIEKMRAVFENLNGVKVKLKKG